MSQVVPAGAVANEAVQFGLHRFGTVIRYAWAPFMGVALLTFAFLAIVVDVEALEAAGEPQGLSAIADALKAPVSVVAALGLVWLALAGLMIAGVGASIYRLVALGEDRPGFFHVRFDGPAIRVFAAAVIKGAAGLGLFMVAVLIAAALTSQPVGGAFEAIGELIKFAENAEDGGPAELPAEMADRIRVALQPVVLGALLAVIPSIYLQVKLLPFVAGSAIENRLVLFKSFRMTFGHAWSLFGAILLFGIFSAIASMIFQLGIGVIGLAGDFLTQQGGGLAIIGAVVAIAVLAASIAFSAFLSGAQAALSAVAYRRLESGA